jgi:hypothetical protein
METDAFYRVQAWMFGEGTDFWTIFVKVVVDQFVWNPVYAAPSNSTASSLLSLFVYLLIIIIIIIILY